jgi:uncharacterized Zn-finger protein
VSILEVVRDRTHRGLVCSRLGLAFPLVSLYSIGRPAPRIERSVHPYSLSSLVEPCDCLHVASLSGRTLVSLQPLLLKLDLKKMTATSPLAKTLADDMPHICSVCKAKFKHKEHLNRHFGNHAKESAYKCGRCGKTFSRRHGTSVSVCLDIQLTLTSGMC